MPGNEINCKVNPECKVLFLLILKYVCWLVFFFLFIYFLLCFICILKDHLMAGEVNC